MGKLTLTPEVKAKLDEMNAIGEAASMFMIHIHDICKESGEEPSFMTVSRISPENPTPRFFKFLAIEMKEEEFTEEIRKRQMIDGEGQEGVDSMFIHKQEGHI